MPLTRRRNVYGLIVKVAGSAAQAHQFANGALVVATADAEDAAMGAPGNSSSSASSALPATPAAASQPDPPPVAPQRSAAIALGPKSAVRDLKQRLTEVKKAVYGAK